MTLQMNLQMTPSALGELACLEETFQTLLKDPYIPAIKKHIIQQDLLIFSCDAQLKHSATAHLFIDKIHNYSSFTVMSL